MPIDSPLKYSSESFELIRAVHNNNFRFSPESRMVGLTENIDKSNQPVTKQSVLDVFNTQVIERINYLAKYSKQLWMVDVGDYGNSTDPNAHPFLVDHLGYSDTNNEYGVMAVKDYLTLNDFRDQEGAITYDDAANTFSGAISDLSRLGRVRIVVKKGSTPYSDNTYYAILNTRDENLIDYNTIRNSIVGSGNFNSICKSWANKIIDRANNVNVIYYEYKLPDPPPPAEGGVKFLRKEAYFESVNLDGDGRVGQNSVSYGAIFGEGDTTAYFEIPKVTRNLKGVKIHIQTSARLSNDGRYGLTVYNRNSGVILGHVPWSPGTGIRTFYFNNPISLSRDKSYDNLILMLNTKVTGDRGDAMGMVATVEELIFDDNIRISQVSSNANASRINPELIGPIFDTSGKFLKITYKYTLNNCYAKPATIRSTFSRSNQNEHHFIERVEQWRDGVRIGVSQNSTYTENIVNRRVLFSASRFNGNRHNTLITMRHDVSNLDLKNGDELRFIYGYAYRLPSWVNVELGNAIGDLDTFNHERLQLWIDSVLCKEEPISQ
nr:MAG TPA: hypothetical protein [Caudoviricetes sp.]